MLNMNNAAAAIDRERFTESLNFSVTPEMLARIDALVAAKSAAEPGMTYTRSQVVRALILRGVEDAERRLAESNPSTER